VEPKGITIQNVGGPDRSIPAADINRGELLISKRYRNRRLGEYLKELEMTEGRSTGIPTIQNVLKANGSPRAIVVTDEERTFFRITIPCHEAAGNIIADIATREKTQDSSREMVKNISDVLKNVLKDVRKDVLKELSDRQIDILEMVCASPEATLIEMSRKLKVSDKTIQREFTAIRKLGINIERQDGRKEGKWIIMTEGKE
jgi:ATP-dependent DNA helicase RecG